MFVQKFLLHVCVLCRLAFSSWADLTAHQSVIVYCIWFTLSYMTSFASLYGGVIRKISMNSLHLQWWNICLFLQQFNLNLTSSDRLKLLSVLTHFIEIIHQLPKRKCSHYEPTGINLNKIPPVSIFHEKAPSVIRERITRITLSFQRISYIMRTSSNSQYICSEAMWQNTFESGSFQCSFNTVQLWKNLQNSETTFVKA